MLGLDEAIKSEVVEERADIGPLPLIVAQEPAPTLPPRFRLYVPRIVDYLIVAAFIYFLL